MRTDLHTHSTASDGRLTPTQLIELAHARDVRVLALTDHDTLDGVAEAQAAGARVGMRVIAGVEISTLSPEGKEVHILGYGLAPRDDSTRDAIGGLREVRVTRARKILNALNRVGAPVSFERVRALAGDGMIGRPHIARALVEAGHVASVQDAFDRYLAEGAPAYAPNDALTPAEAVKLIHKAHGCAVLAHPSLYRGNLDTLFDHVLEAGLDGIEVLHPDNPDDARARYEALAYRHGLIVTGGSDYHSDNGHHEVSLGVLSLSADRIATLDARIAMYAI